jgi:hypothetical protein
MAGVTATAITAAPLVATGVAASLAKPQRKPLPPMISGSVLSVEALQRMVDRVNELSEA